MPVRPCPRATPCHRVRAFAVAVATPLAIAAATLVPDTAAAQYFGRNKVNYETYDFRILRTPKFDVHFYPAESTATADAGRLAERWYARLSPFVRHQFDRRSIIFFADQPDFQQNNVTTIESEGTGGVTESFRQRVIMPFTGSYAETNHVLGHELVHVFQYDIAANAPAGGAQRMNTLPLWLIEGMAEYLSLGRADANTAMWLRDAARRNDVPSIRQLTNDPRYFPYRYGQALWAYVGGRWGDQAVVDVYRTALRFGFEDAIRRVLDVTGEQLSKEWGAAIKAQYLPLIPGRTAPDSTATVFVRQKGKRGGEYNIAPTISPDGRRVLYFSSRDLFGIDLYVADAETGKIIKRLGSVNTARHFDALSFITSSGAWSPDGRRVAYVVYREGNQEVEVYDLERGRAERRIGAKEIGAVTDPAWSPDGRYMAFSGQVGGISDLFLYDFESRQIQRLTDDRLAQLQPAWSPDGKTLAFVTDQGDATDFEQLTFGPMRLATMDVATRQITLFRTLARGKAINPQYSADGKSLYFIADPDGFPDVYRAEFETRNTYRITKTATGISGITSLSPALSVARGSGRVVFSVFDRGGYHLARLDGAQTTGTAAPLELSERGAATAAGTSDAPGAVLPPGSAQTPSVIERYLADAATGLPRDTSYATAGYNPRLHLDIVAPPTVGAQIGGPFGGGIAGSIGASFSDQVGNRNLQAVVLAQGQIQDIGGQVIYQNLRRRWNWGLLASHIPYLAAGAAYSENPNLPAGLYEYTQYIQRTYVTQLGLISQYPLSSTRRFEFQLTGTRQGYGLQGDTYIVDGAGNVYDRIGTSSLDTPDAFYYGQGAAAFVGDYSLFGFTSPLAGARYRFEVTPTFGGINFTTALADYRRYWLARPITFAFRGMHVGRYGKDAEDETRLYPLFAGNPYYVRGYDYNSFETTECRAPAGAGSSNLCPAFDRLLGSRMAVVNAEMRIPLFGPEGLGVFPTSFLPVEITPFFDGAMSWSSTRSPSVKWAGADEARTSLAAIPVFSAGVSTRFNLFGLFIGEVFYVVPFQRPDKGGFWGFQLLPGW